MDNFVDIQSLITQGRVASTADLDPINDYLVIGKFQTGNRKSNSSNNAYKNYAIKLSEVIGGVPPITLNIIPKGTGASITDGNWQFSGSAIAPNVTGSNIGTAALRVGTIYMASTIDYASALTWVSTTETMRLTTAGNLGIGTNAPALRLSVVSDTTNDFEAARFYGSNLISYLSLGLGGLSSNSYLKLNSATGQDITLNTGQYILLSGGNTGAGISTPTATIHAKGIDATSGNFTLKVENSASTVLLYARNDGNVGINTSTPGYNLEVSGTFRAGTGASNQVFYNGSIFHAKINDNNWIGVNRDGLQITEMWGYGAVFMYNTATTCAMGISSTLYSYIRENTTITFSRTDNNVYALWDSTNYKLRIGSLGVGPSAATSSLHITGTGYSQLRLENSYTPSSSADANGNVGDVAWDDSYIYVKVSTGWERAGLSAF